MKFKEHAVGICQYDNIFDAGNFIELLEEECSQDWDMCDGKSLPLAKDKFLIQGHQWGAN